MRRRPCADVLAEDDDSYEPVLPDAHAPKSHDKVSTGSQLLLQPTADWFQQPSAQAAAPEYVLLLLNRMIAPGSELHIMCSLPVAAREARFAEAGITRKATPKVASRALDPVRRCRKDDGRGDPAACASRV